ncbi:MAG: efflux RND transporter periplasmic adaptor subunit [Gammaproteobacteria bacterium]|nr:efflux RND transporter periplasmic adaptor subunit [Gammaproteobacteria bacterium]MDH4255586.1 efflux RND transporter periplasmic adaptor subunit [Gammaproteobacteria bacterium]MDH5311948.1 efflux RND transporter periplasmic adaptor subunit [Gammaproteobacteria bacterium]
MGIRIEDTSAQDIRLAAPGNRRRLVIGSSVALALAVLVWLSVPVVGRWANATVTVPAERLRIASVERGDLVRDVAVQGRVVAAVSPTLYAPAAGTITLAVDAGASVEAGQILARIDSPELANSLQQARSALAQQEVELDRQRIESRQLALEKRKQADLAEVALIAAEREKRRADAANDVKVISVIDFEKAQDDLRNAELAHAHAVADASLFDERLAFELKASELALDRQRLLVADLDRQVDELAIRSPVNGIVGDLLVAQKAAVSRDTPVMAVVDLTVFEVDAQIPESYADDLAIGMPAEITIGGRIYQAQLAAVSPEIVANQVSTRVRFVGESPANIRQNQRLSTRILLEERSNVLTLQRGQFLDSGGGRIAYVLDGSGLAHRRSIEIGARSLAAVEVLAGLQEGEQVVISSVDQFRGAETVFVSN